ncbi:restriction endonuclease subunit S [Treponema phagedenis]|uniref:restriction endonuclease subunit S n=1 Tax=Treponema phagedenis TaxID=162 RepID=UPI0002EC3C98|nr:restriction endonuclease subunit S [Treponema phagedenis]
MSKLNLKDVEWKEFFLGGEKGLFTVSGSVTTHPTELVKDGLTPRITCAATNNGLENFYKNIPTEKGGVLTVDSATIGYIAFQNNDFIATDHVEKIIRKDGQRFSKEVGLFLKTAIDKSVFNKYGYGYKFSQTRIRRQKIMLPVDNQGNPHWEFMENYIKQEQKAQVQKIIDYYEQKILQNGFTLLDFKNIEWKAFKFNEIFRKIKRGKRLTKANQITGNIPYISSTALNNGIDNFIKNSGNVRKGKNALTVANSGSVGSCFYHCYEYIASDHVTSLQASNADKYIYLFMSTIIKRLEEKYSFNREINDERIKAEKIILPIDKNGNPHWEYMSKFMQKLEVEKISNFLPYIYIYIYKVACSIEKTVYNITSSKWQEFWIEDICTIKSGQRLVKAQQQMGTIPFIGASDSDNGITAFISNINSSVDKNVLGVNYNGSVVHNFYHPYKCIFSDDVKRLHFKCTPAKNEATYLFLKQALLQQKGKYTYGYKFTGERMKRQKIILPITEQQTPDYNFMQKYILIQEIKEIYKALQYLHTSY